MNRWFTPRLQCLWVALAAAGVLALAHILEGFGWQPCELCLRQRIPYWWGVTLAGLAWFVWPSRFLWVKRLPPYLMAGAAIAFTIGAGLAVQHIGVEQGWWKSECSSSGGGGISDLMNGIGTQRIVSCNEKRPFLFGLTLAVYNLIISAGLAAFAASIVVRAIVNQTKSPS